MRHAAHPSTEVADRTAGGPGSWPVVVAVAAVVAAGVVGGLFARGSWSSRALVGVAVLGLAALAFALPLWLLQSELRRLRGLEEAAARNAAASPPASATGTAATDVDDGLHELVARGAHDLRTPLNTLAGMVDTLVRLGDDLTPPQRAELHAALQRSTRRIAGWITVLLDTAVDPTHDADRVVETPVQPLLEEAVTVSIAATAGLEVEVVPTDLRVRVDPGAVVRVVSNLLANAGHHAGGGTVELEARPRGRWVEVRVSDHGEGWGPEAGPGAGRGPTGARSHHAGLGLGLASVRSHIEDWDGQLEFDETPGGGATVRFTLPGATATDDPAEGGRAADPVAGWTIAGGESFLQNVHRIH